MILFKMMFFSGEVIDLIDFFWNGWLWCLQHLFQWGNRWIGFLFSGSDYFFWNLIDFGFEITLLF